MSNSQSPAPAPGAPAAPGTLAAPLNPPEAEYKKEFLESYGKFGATLRQWLGGYAAGMFGFLALNDARWNALIASGKISLIGWLLLSGIASQLIAVFLYKTSNSMGWLVAAGQKKPKGLIYSLCNAITDSIWFDVVTDLFSIFAFLFATFLIFNVIQPAASSKSSTPIETQERAVPDRHGVWFQ